MDTGAMLTVVIPATGVLVWLIRLEGRVNTNEALQREIAAEVGISAIGSTAR